MRFISYRSKTWFLTLLSFVGIFAGIIALAWNRMPLMFQIVFSAIVSIATILIILNLAKTSPVITADEDGLSCYKAFYGTIAWKDIEGSIRVPRREEYQEYNKTCYRWSFTEGWRPIDVYVRDIDKYSKLIPRRVHALLIQQGISPDFPNCFRLRIDLTGTTGSSEDLDTVIQHYLKENKKT